MTDEKQGTTKTETKQGAAVGGSRARYERVLAEQEQAGKGSGAGAGSKSDRAGPICPRLRRGAEGKGCRYFVRGGSCRLTEAFLCVEYMRKRGFDDERIRGACVELARLPLEGGAGRPELGSEGGSAGVPSYRAVSEAEQKRIVALVRATEADIAGLEAIDFRAVLDVPHLGGVEIVNKYRPTGTRQLSIRHALLLAAVTACFPGATVSQLEIAQQPGPKGGD